jgi:ABC-type lipoprotein release transport system permease subunit
VLLLAVSATVATLLPAIRASSVSPLVALQAE